MAQEPFEAWLARKSWAQGVRYSTTVAWLLPPASLLLDAPQFWGGAAWDAGFIALLAWQIAAELFFLAVLAADRWHTPASHERALGLACAGALVLATWIGVAAQLRSGDLAIYTTGLTFVAAVMCAPRPLRRPYYWLTLPPLAAAALWRSGDLLATGYAMINPFCVVLLCTVLDRFTHSRNLELFEEKRRADQVLQHNVLPVAVAEELKLTNGVKARQYDNMGVLFADIVGFTEFSRSLSPGALVKLLNRMFCAFDERVARHGLEKIKTIGDAYMVISYERIDALCELALELQRAMARCNQDCGTALSLRIGLHCGPAVAGVIGSRRFSYDIWGDTVNVASRMEGAGESGRVHVSEAVYLHAREYFHFEPRGLVHVKGCGPMWTSWLLGAKAPEQIVL